MFSYFRYVNVWFAVWWSSVTWCVSRNVGQSLLFGGQVSFTGFFTVLSVFLSAYLVSVGCGYCVVLYDKYCLRHVVLLEFVV